MGRAWDTDGTNNHTGNKSMASKSKLTTKQHAFALAMATGTMTQADAYRQSYNAEKMKGATVRTEASKLMVNPHVASMIKTLLGRKEAAVIAAGVSDADLVRDRLRTMMASALPSDSVKLGATIALGKSCGVFAEVIEHKEHRTPEQILDDIDRRLAADEADADGDMSGDGSEESAALH